MPVGAVVAAVAAVALVAVAVAVAGGGSGKKVETGGAAASTSSPPSTVPPEPFPSAGSTVHPGFFVTTRFQPRFTARLQDEWVLNLETDQDIELQGPNAGPGLLSVLAATHPLDRNQVFATIDQALQPSSTEPPPDDGIGWLRSHQALSVSAATPARLLGHDGAHVDVTVRPGQGTVACEAECVPLFHVGDDKVFSLVEDNVNRVYQVKVGEIPVLVVLEAPADAFASFLEKAEPLLETMTLLDGAITTLPSLPDGGKVDDPATTSRPPVKVSPTSPAPAPAGPAATAPPSPAPTTPPATAAVIHTFPDSPDGRFRAVRSGNNFQVVSQPGNAVVLTTFDELKGDNEVQLAAFSADSNIFAAAYRYSDGGLYTWIGYWSTSTGGLVNSKKVTGFLTSMYGQV